MPIASATSIKNFLTYLIGRFLRKRVPKIAVGYRLAKGLGAFLSTIKIHNPGSICVSACIAGLCCMPHQTLGWKPKVAIGQLPIRIPRWVHLPYCIPSLLLLRLDIVPSLLLKELVGKVFPQVGRGYQTQSFWRMALAILPPAYMPM